MNLQSLLDALKDRVSSLEKDARNEPRTVTCSQCGKRGHNVRIHRRELELEAEVDRLERELEASERQNKQLVEGGTQMSKQIQDLRRQLAMIVYGD
jgi:hypothetical protein